MGTDVYFFWWRPLFPLFFRPVFFFPFLLLRLLVFWAGKNINKINVGRLQQDYERNSWFLGAISFILFFLSFIGAQKSASARIKPPAGRKAPQKIKGQRITAEELMTAAAFLFQTLLRLHLFFLDVFSFAAAVWKFIYFIRTPLSGRSRVPPAQIKN